MNIEIIRFKIDGVFPGKCSQYQRGIANKMNGVK